MTNCIARSLIVLRMVILRGGGGGEGPPILPLGPSFLSHAYTAYDWPHRFLFLILRLLLSRAARLLPCAACPVTGEAHAVEYVVGYHLQACWLSPTVAPFCRLPSQFFLYTSLGGGGGGVRAFRSTSVDLFVIHSCLSNDFLCQPRE